MFVYGNFGPETAKEVGKNVKDILDFNPVPIEELPEVHTLNVTSQRCTTICQDLTDKSNPNSCVLTCY